MNVGILPDQKIEARVGQHLTATLTIPGNRFAALTELIMFSGLSRDAFFSLNIEFKLNYILRCMAISKESINPDRVDEWNCSLFRRKGFIEGYQEEYSEKKYVYLDKPPSPLKSDVATIDFSCNRDPDPFKETLSLFEQKTERSSSGFVKDLILEFFAKNNLLSSTVTNPNSLREERHLISATDSLERIERIEFWHPFGWPKYFPAYLETGEGPRIVDFTFLASSEKPKRLQLRFRDYEQNSDPFRVLLPQVAHHMGLSSSSLPKLIYMTCLHMWGVVDSYGCLKRNYKEIIFHLGRSGRIPTNSK